MHLRKVCWGLPGFLIVFLLGIQASAEHLEILEPQELQVIQRNSRNQAKIRVRFRWQDSRSQQVSFEVRLQDGRSKPWTKLETRKIGDDHIGFVAADAGGWYRLELKAMLDQQIVAEGVIERFGVGEVFVVAGQSNSANHGEKKLTTETQRVSSFNGKGWKLANDPQEGASGQGGSVMPPLGDLLVRHFDLPIGFIPCGIGASSVREWLPAGSSFPNPPTIETRVEKNEDGSWRSLGKAYETLLDKMLPWGEQGFRAVLWHQGESDANQKDPSRTLAGELYRKYLTQIIEESRNEIGWRASWFVAQVSYHVPGDEASPDIRLAQASLWSDGTALEGPDSDSLKGEMRERKGQGVHFSELGLREHARLWAEKLEPWIAREMENNTWVKPDRRDLILVAGQSNAVGFDAYASELLPDPVDSKVRFWWRCGDPPPDQHDSSHARWTSLQSQPIGDPLDRRQTDIQGEPQFGLKRQYGNFKKPEGGFGPEIALARELIKKQNQPIAIVKVAFSGTGMQTDWNPNDQGSGGACYRSLIEEARKAIDSAWVDGWKVNLKAMVWVQGESDANGQAASLYERSLGSMVEQLRLDLQAPEMIALLGVNTRFGNGKNPHMETIIASQRRIAETITRSRYVDTEGAETLPPNHTHFTSRGTLDMGSRFARVLLEFADR